MFAFLGICLEEGGGGRGNGERLRKLLIRCWFGDWPKFGLYLCCAVLLLLLLLLLLFYTRWTLVNNDSLYIYIPVWGFGQRSVFLVL